jgi:hypothetical protein
MTLGTSLGEDIVAGSKLRRKLLADEALLTSVADGVEIGGGSGRRCGPNADDTAHRERGDPDP